MEESVSSKKDAEVTIERIHNDLAATIHVFPPLEEGADITEEMIRKALADNKITFGIIDAVIGRIVAQKEYNKVFHIAEGKPPIDGQDAQLIFHYSLKTNLNTSKDSLSEKIDYRELYKIINCKKGDLLLEKIPCTEGEAGVTVTGKAIRQVRGKDIRIRAAKGAQADPTGLKYYAILDGQVIFRSNTIQVEDVYQAENVDASVGNIHFNGSVIISGIVEDHYMIEAQGDVRIAGGVGAVNISANGNITIAGGIFGGNACKITSTNGNVYTKFAQDAVIEASGDIFIEDYARSCILSAGGEICVINDNPKRGHIMGGKYSAFKSIICNLVGSEAETLTELYIGIGVKMLEEISYLERNILELRYNFENLKKSSVLLQDMLRKNGGLPKEKNEMLHKILSTLPSIRSQCDEKLHRLHEIFAMTYRKTDGFVKVKEKAFPNVKITIHDFSLSLTSPSISTVFKEKNGRIVMGQILAQ